jgi:hypothetical protein
MALDATVAGVNANSYLSVSAADAFAAADLGPEVDAWVAATTDQKERALKRATREIDGYLRSGWARYVITQALLFPREVDYSGSPVAAFIPRNIQLACYEQATYVLRNAAVLDNARTRRARDMQSASEPNISYTTAEESGFLSDAALAYVDLYRRTGGARGLRSVRVSGYAW